MDFKIQMVYKLFIRIMPNLLILQEITALKNSVWNGIRLSGGNSYSGRLELKIAGIWGTVCNHGWTYQNSQVVCRQLGFSGVFTPLSENGLYGNGQGYIYFSNVSCSGRENELEFCGGDIEMELNSCTHRDDVGIACRKPEQFQEPISCTQQQFKCSGVNMCIPKRWSCDFTADCEDASDEQNCTPTTQFPLPSNPYRLVGGNGAYEGRLELHYLNVWGTVCDDGFGMTESNVICREMGFRGAVQTKAFGSGTGQIWLDEVNCQGNETSLLKCRRNDLAAHDCDHTEDVGVVCQDCGTQKIPVKASRIVGGEPANRGSWPWQASIRLVLHTGNSEHLCGGTLIKDNWILTAAHCFDGSRSPRKYKVRLGDHDMKTNEHTEQEYNVTEIRRHNNYRPNKHPYDIALVRLEQAVETNDYVHTACLPSTEEPEFNQNDYCFATGWGETKATGDHNILRQVRLPLYNFFNCQTVYGYRSILSSMLCAGYEYGGKDTCKGDSGGPLVCNRRGQWELAGIVSWGNGCAEPHHPGVYTRVNYFLNWINQNTLTRSRSRTYRFW